MVKLSSVHLPHLKTVSVWENVKNDYIDFSLFYSNNYINIKYQSKFFYRG